MRPCVCSRDIGFPVSEGNISGAQLPVSRWIFYGQERDGRGDIVTASSEDWLEQEQAVAPGTVINAP